MPKCQTSQYLCLPPPHCHSTHWATQSYTTVTSLTMTPELCLEVGTTSYRVTCWYKNLSYNDMLLFYQKQYLYFLMISISATCCTMRGYRVHSCELWCLIGAPACWHCPPGDKNPRRSHLLPLHLAHDLPLQDLRCPKHWHPQLLHSHPVRLSHWLWPHREHCWCSRPLCLSGGVPAPCCRSCRRRISGALPDRNNSGHSR